MISAWMISLVPLFGLPGDGPRPLEVRAPAGSAKVSFANDLAEVLDAKCVGCHGNALAEGRLSMETVASMRKGGKRGPSIVAGKADESLLFRMAAHRVEPVMPPKEKKELKPLDPGELGLLKRWIDEGAQDDSVVAPAPAAPVAIGSLPAGVHPINAVDMTADGRRVAAGRGNLVEVFDVDSGTEIIRLGGHRDLIQSVRFSPDGRTLAAGSYQVVTTWTAPTASVARAFAGSAGPIRAMVALRDGKTLVTAGAENAVRFWNAADGKPSLVAAVPAGTVALAISADESLLAAAGLDGAIRLISTADGKERRSWQGTGPEIGGLAFLPDGKGLVSGCRDGTVVLWTIPPGAETAVGSRMMATGGRRPVQGLAVLDDGKSLVVADEESIRTIRLADGKELRSFPVRSRGQKPEAKEIAPGAPPALKVSSLALSPDQRLILAGSTDGKARLIAADSGQAAATFGPLAAAIIGVAFSPGGDRALLSAEDGSFGIFQIAGGRPLIVVGEPAAKKGDKPTPGRPAIFLGEGRVATAGGNLARYWAIEGSWSEGRALGPHAGRVLAIDFSPDGRLVATGGGDPSRSGEVKIWEAKTGKLVRSLDTLHSDTVFALSFSPDGKKLASVAADKFLKVIDVESGKELRSLEGHTHHVLAVDWSKDGKRLVTGGADNAVKVWDYESGEQSRALSPATKQVTGLRWLAGKALVVGSAGDGSVRAWNPDNGTVPRTYEGGADFLFAVAASADGGRVAAGGADGVLLIWNGAGGEPIRKIGLGGPHGPISTPAGP